MLRRYWALVIMRILAVLLIIYGGTHIVQAIGSAYGLAVFGSGSSFFLQLVGVFWDDNYNPFWFGFAIAMMGVGLGWASRRLSRWIIPLIANECPACGYTLQQLTTARCPECGFQGIESQQPGGQR